MIKPGFAKLKNSDRGGKNIGQKKTHHILSNPNAVDSGKILYYVSGLGTPLVDILAVVDNDFLTVTGLNRSIMQLIDKERTNSYRRSRVVSTILFGQLI